MRTVLTNFGTVGDIQPFLALAVELQQHGHEPVVALAPNFESSVTKLGLAFAPIGPDLQKQQRQIIGSQLSINNSPENLKSMFAPLAFALPQVYEDLVAVCEKADVLISGAAQPVSRIVHEVTGIDFVSVQLAHFGGSGRPGYQQAVSLVVNPFRTRLGLRPLAGLLADDANSTQLALYAMSAHVVKPPRDWPDHHRMVGYFFLDENDFTPDPALREFLDAGEPPIFITMGSATYYDSSAMSNLILDALSQVGRRALVQHGWSGLASGRSLPSNVSTVGYVPHNWLFPRTACVVHHGGVGTAAAVYRSGVPSVYITHGPPLHARIAQELGCAGPYVSFWELSSERVAEAINITVNNASYSHSAAALGEKIRAENGVQKARQLIEQLVYRNAKNN